MRVKRVKWEKQNPKKVMEGRERIEVFDDTAVSCRVYRAKWLCLSIQLKRIKGCNEWQTNLAPLATQLPQPDLLPPPMPSSTHLCSCLFLLPLLSFPSPVPISAPLPCPFYACVTVNLLFYKSHSAITLYCLWATYKACQFLCAYSPIPCKED